MLKNQFEASELVQLVAASADAGVFNRTLGTPNILKMASILAGLETAIYYTNVALTARSFDSKAALLDYAVESSGVDGLVLEFGVGGGDSLRQLASLVDHVIGFDSFKGLPEAWRTGWPKGMFAQPAPGNLPDNATLEIGLFSDTLPQFGETNKGKVIRFMHVDCDLYSSTKSIFDALGGHITEGTIILFDEYWNYAGWKQHEHKAFQEFIASSSWKYEYIGFVPNGVQAAVRIWRA